MVDSWVACLVLPCRHSVSISLQISTLGFGGRGCDCFVFLDGLSSLALEYWHAQSIPLDEILQTVIKSC